MHRTVPTSGARANTEISVSVLCPQCALKLKAPWVLAGKVARCPQCKTIIPIPFERQPNTEASVQARDLLGEPLSTSRTPEERRPQGLPNDNPAEIIRPTRTDCAALSADGAGMSVDSISVVGQSPALRLASQLVPLASQRGPSDNSQPYDSQQRAEVAARIALGETVAVSKRPDFAGVQGASTIQGDSKIGAGNVPRSAATGGVASLGKVSDLRPRGERTRVQTLATLEQANRNVNQPFDNSANLPAPVAGVAPHLVPAAVVVQSAAPAVTSQRQPDEVVGSVSTNISWSVAGQLAPVSLARPVAGKDSHDSAVPDVVPTATRPTLAPRTAMSAAPAGSAVAPLGTSVGPQVDGADGVPLPVNHHDVAMAVKPAAAVPGDNAMLRVPVSPPLNHSYLARSPDLNFPKLYSPPPPGSGQLWAGAQANGSAVPDPGPNWMIWGTLGGLVSATLLGIGAWMMMYAA